MQGIINVGTEFAIFNNKNSRKFEFYCYRPTKMIKDQENLVTKEKVIKDWWKFALKYAQGQVNSKEKKWIILTKNKKIDFKERFMPMYDRILETPTKSDFGVLDQEDQRYYENVLMSLSTPVITKWVEEKVKQEKIEEQMQVEKKRKTGVLKGWFTK